MEGREQLPEQDTSTKAVLNTPASQSAQLECGHEPAGWGSVPGYRQRGAPGYNPSLGDIAAHPSLTTEPILQGLGEIRTRLSRTFQQAIANPDACAGATAMLGRASWVMPQPTPSPQLLPWARHWCFPPGTEASAMSSQGPVRSLWPGQTSPGTYGKRVRWMTHRASLGGCRTKSCGLSPHPSTAGQPLGLPCFLPWGIKGSTWLTLEGLLPSLSPSQMAQG